MSIHEHANALQEAFSELEDDLEPGVYQTLAPSIEALSGAVKASEIYMQNMETIFRIMKLMKKHPEMTLINTALPVWEGLQNPVEADVVIVPHPPQEAVDPAPVTRGEGVQRWFIQDDVQEDDGAAPINPLQTTRAAGPRTNARIPRANDAFPQPVFNDWIARHIAQPGENRV